MCMMHLRQAQLACAFWLHLAACLWARAEAQTENVGALRTFPRPHLYWGLEDALSSAQIGVGWMSGSDTSSYRYAASDEHGMKRWGWYRNDGGSFAQQQVADIKNRLIVHSDWISPSSNSTVSKQGAWSLRMTVKRAAAASLAKRRRQAASAATNATAAALQQPPVSFFVHVAMPRSLVRPLGSAEMSSSPHAAAGVVVGANGVAAVAVLQHGTQGGYGGQPLNAYTTVDTRAACVNGSGQGLECLPEMQPPLARDCSHVRGDAVGMKLCEAAYGDAEAAVGGKASRSAFGKATSAAATWPLPAAAGNSSFAHATCWGADEGRHWDMQTLQGRLQSARLGVLSAARAGLASGAGRGVPPLALPLLGGGTCSKNATEKTHNVVVLQVIVQPPATLDIVFLPEAALSASPVLGAWAGGEIISQADLASAIQEQGIAVGSTMQPAIHTAVDAFEERLGQKLQLQPSKVQPEQDGDAMQEVSWGALATRFALSNMVGCITRFQGSMLVATDVGGFESESHAAAPHSPAAPHTLFSGMPSRTLFPRGFLWDEGFHQLLVMKWRPQLSMQVLESWFATQQAGAERGTLRHGWVAREQILGEEALTRVPQRFAVQRPDVANPPTMLLALQQLLQASSPSQPDLKPWLQQLYPALQRWYAWFLRTQRIGTRVRELEQGWAGAGEPPLEWLQARKALSGDEPQLWLQGRLAAGGWDGQDQRGFQWQGSSPDHTFACGLDDSPRGVVPTDKDEHLDLLAWMVFSARTLGSIAKFLGNTKHEQLFTADQDKFQGWMGRHWSSSAQGGAGWFCDVGAEAVFPEMRHPRTQQVAPQEISISKAERDMMVKHFLRSQTLSHAQASALAPGARIGHVCHRSYLALFPLLLHSLPAGDRRLVPLIRAVTQGDMLGPGGVKSLSSDSPLFGSKDDYWRGKAWMNINYMLVQALEQYAATPLQTSSANAQGGPVSPVETGEAGPTGVGVVDFLWQWATGTQVGGAAPSTGIMSADEWRGLQQEARSAARRIRSTIVENMVHKYETQGSLFENYEADRGMGTGTAPFTGWTGAVLPLLRSASTAAASVAEAVGSDGGIES